MSSRYEHTGLQEKQRAPRQADCRATPVLPIYHAAIVRTLETGAVRRQYDGQAMKKALAEGELLEHLDGFTQSDPQKRCTCDDAYIAHSAENQAHIACCPFVC